MRPILSVLDQSTVAAGRDPGAAIRETLALARHCEALGYRRYWLAEHHNTGAHAGTAPEVLAAAVAATTARIRVGSAGVMLPHYAPLKVAECFRVLEAIAPGRIDLGLGRAPGSDGRTAFALNPDAARAAEGFPQAVADLLGWLGEGLPVGHPFRSVSAQPAVPTAPEIWILGSSDYGAQVAAHYGLAYCFAQFFSEDLPSVEAIALYRARFVPQPGAPLRRTASHAALAVSALAAPTAAEAWRHFRSRALWRLLRDRGLFVPLPSVAEAEAYEFSPAERARVDAMRQTAAVGTGAQVAAQLEAIAAEHGGVDELAVITHCHDAEARRRSYTELADAWGLRDVSRLAAE